METHVTGQPLLGELRQHVLATLFGNPLFSEAERLRAHYFVHDCADVARLTRWHANVRAELARRQAAAAHQRGQATLRATLRRLCPANFRGYRPRQPCPTPAWVPGTPLPDRADRYAGTFDRAAVARFHPADTLLLGRPF